MAFVLFVLSDDVVYQQTGVGGATLDKRRPDLRDELGYIAPPNRKLPPVPGSNYNTCDRIKRGTVISKPQLPTIWFLAKFQLLSRCCRIGTIVLPLFLFYVTHDRIAQVNTILDLTSLSDKSAYRYVVEIPHTYTPRHMIHTRVHHSHLPVVSLFASLQNVFSLCPTGTVISPPSIFALITFCCAYQAPIPSWTISPCAHSWWPRESSMKSITPITSFGNEPKPNRIGKRQSVVRPL